MQTEVVFLRSVRRIISFDLRIHGVMHKFATRINQLIIRVRIIFFPSNIFLNVRTTHTFSHFSPLSVTSPIMPLSCTLRVPQLRNLMETATAGANLTSVYLLSRWQAFKNLNQLPNFAFSCALAKWRRSKSNEETAADLMVRFGKEGRRVHVWERGRERERRVGGDSSLLCSNYH